jgi:hypothetical protein
MYVYCAVRAAYLNKSLPFVNKGLNKILNPLIFSMCSIGVTSASEIHLDTWLCRSHTNSCNNKQYFSQVSKNGTASFFTLVWLNRRGVKTEEPLLLIGIFHSYFMRPQRYSVKKMNIAWDRTRSTSILYQASHLFLVHDDALSTTQNVRSRRRNYRIRYRKIGL